MCKLSKMLRYRNGNFPSVYVFSNLLSCRWEEATGVRLEMNGVGIKKGAGFSRIAV